MYKTAIIGLGQIGYKIDEDSFRTIIWSHAKAYKKHNKTKLIAVCDIDKTSYDDFKIYYPNIDFYDDYVKMVEDVEIDIVSICTPTPTHLDIVRNIAKSKPPKAIFIEKPMGKNIKEAHEIVKLCKDSGTILAVNYMRRWENKYRSIKKLIDDNIMGDLYSLTAYGSTALLTSTSHLIDIFLYYGGDIAWLIGKLQKDYVRKVHGVSDKGGCAFVKFKNGAFGFLKGISKNPYNYMFEIDLLFSDGRVTISKDGAKISIEKFTSNDKSSGSKYKTLEQIKSNEFKMIDNERMVDAVSDIIYSIETDRYTDSNGLNAIEVHRFIQNIKDSNTKGDKIIYD